MIIENDCCIVCTPPPLSAGGGGIEPGTKFSKREGALQDLNFYMGVAGKEGGTFFQGGVAVFT